MKPIFVTPAIKDGEKVSFFQKFEQITIGPEDSKEILEIFKASDGSRSLNQISEATKIPINKVSEIVSELQNLEIVVDSEKNAKKIITNTYDFSSNLDERISIMSEFVGVDKPVKRVWLDIDLEDGSFYAANAMFYDAYGRTQFAGGTSTSPFDALFKAAVEGYERWRSSQIRVDRHCPSKELTRKIDPFEIAPLTYFQAKKTGVKFFDEKLPIDWTIGTMLSGKEIYVPSDLVYYGHRDGENRIYYGNSSGIAAFTDLEEAKKRALVELIERDALMRNWFSHESPNIISRTKLPDVIKNRVVKWKKRGRELFVLHIPSEYGRVIMAIFVSDKYPFFVSGAAATIDDGKTCEAICKAVNEAEFNLIFAIKNREEYSQKIQKKQIVYPIDHGRFYYSAENAKKLSWLWRGKIVKNLSSLKSMPFDELCEKLHAITVDLSDPNSSIKVVKMISSDLVPINFGYYTAHYTHSSVEKISSKSLKYPHYFS